MVLEQSVNDSWWSYRDSCHAPTTKSPSAIAMGGQARKTRTATGSPRPLGFESHNHNQIEKTSFAGPFYLVELQGLEPWTSSMPWKRSSQLSYSPSSRQAAILQGGPAKQVCRSTKQDLRCRSSQNVKQPSAWFDILVELQDKAIVSKSPLFCNSRSATNGDVRLDLFLMA